MFLKVSHFDKMRVRCITKVKDLRMFFKKTLSNKSFNYFSNENFIIIMLTRMK